MSVFSLARMFGYHGVCRVATPGSPCMIETRCMPTCVATKVRRRQRKPGWYPMAKTKVFIVRKRPHVDPVDQAETRRLVYTYRTKMASLRQYFYNERLRMQSVLTESGGITTEEMERRDHARLMQLNQHENERIAEIRMKKLADAAEEIRIKVAQWKLDDAEQKRIERQKAIDIIEEQQERSKHYITRDYLMQTIEKAIDNPVDFNFAVDSNGKVLAGRFGRAQTTGVSSRPS